MIPHLLKYTKAKLLLILTILGCLLSSCNYANDILPNASSDNVYTRSDIFFDTYTTISIYGVNDKDSELIIDECFKQCKYYENLFSVSIPTSEVARINNNETGPISVTKPTIDLLHTAINYSKDNDGLFDITIYSVGKLWDFHEESPVIPSCDQIQNALKHVGYNNIKVDNDLLEVSKEDSLAQIDLGGIAKGYIADRISDYIKTTAATGAIINIGGDMMLIGTKPDNTLFTIGINDPFGNSTPIKSLKISDKSVATSGTYIRKLNDSDKEYHHILDPNTGYPVSTDLISATIIADKAMDADTLCTISILLGSKKATDYIESLPNTEAILITENGSIITTSGAKSYLMN